jgi:hypothetical protein
VLRNGQRPVLLLRCMPRHRISHAAPVLADPHAWAKDGAAPLHCPIDANVGNKRLGC